jgi:hypothetical protein
LSECSDWGVAHPAGLAGAAIDEICLLEIARVAIGTKEVAQAAATGL